MNISPESNIILMEIKCLTQDFPSQLKSSDADVKKAPAAKIAVTSLMGGICAEGQPLPLGLTAFLKASLWLCTVSLYIHTVH